VEPVKKRAAVSVGDSGGATQLSTKYAPDPWPLEK
jgi:hypothetical protein